MACKAAAAPGHVPVGHQVTRRHQACPFLADEEVTVVDGDCRERRQRPEVCMLTGGSGRVVRPETRAV